LAHHTTLTNKRGAGTCDEALRMSAWEADLYKLMIFFKKLAFYVGFNHEGALATTTTLQWETSLEKQFTCLSHVSRD